MKCYLTGGYTNEEASHAEHLLQNDSMWGEIVNSQNYPPPPVGCGDTDWIYYLRRGLGDLVTSDAILLLPQWNHNQKARIEAFIASSLNLESYIFRFEPFGPPYFSTFAFYPSWPTILGA